MRGALLWWPAICLAEMYPGELTLESRWITNPDYYKMYSSYEERRYFYPKEFLNEGDPVTFYVYEAPGVSALESKCRGATERTDYILHDQMVSHPWRVKNIEEAHFVFVPTWAGVVLDGQCESGALETLKQLLHSLMSRSLWKSTHGHAFITYSSTEAVHELLLRRTEKIVKAGFRYKLNEFERANPPDEVIDYVLSQVISLERFYRPTMQYCQLFRPQLLQHDLGGIPAEEPPYSISPHVAETWKSSRPTQLAMVESLVLGDNKYTAREQAYKILSKGNSNKAELVIAGETTPELQNFARCDHNEAVLENCRLDGLGQNGTASIRDSVLSRTRFALITRGAYPHEDNLYQAVQQNNIIINTIDKNLDSALPFQCQVPWEEFTLRIGSKAFEKDPAGEVARVIGSLSDEQIVKMLGIQQYYRPDLLLTPGFGQHSRIIENVFLNALRRCSTEQQNRPRGITAHKTRCPFTDWAKPMILMRTVHNVDRPAWEDL